MYTDFIIIDTDTKDDEVRDTIKHIIDNSLVNSITVPYYFLKLIKPFIQNGLDFSCLIDFPLGVSDPKTRLFAASQAVKSGFNTLDIAMPQNWAANRKYDKIRDDIKGICDLKAENNFTIRYILEYRKFDHHCLKKICEILENFGIQYVFPSSGYFIDNMADNILASIFLYKNSKDLKIISTGNAWQDHHFDTLGKSGLFGFRTSSTHILDNFVKFNLSRKQ